MLRYGVSCPILVFLGLIALSGCNLPGDSEKATDAALEGLEKKYTELKDGLPGEVADWTARDLEQIGDWEYTQVSVPRDSLPHLAQRLNDFGNHRWEAFWMEGEGSRMTVMMKRRSRSYLGQVKRLRP